MTTSVRMELIEEMNGLGPIKITERFDPHHHYAVFVDECTCDRDPLEKR